MDITRTCVSELFGGEEKYIMRLNENNGWTTLRVSVICVSTCVRVCVYNKLSNLRVPEKNNIAKKNYFLFKFIFLLRF